MNNLLKLLPMKVLIKTLLDIAKIIASKTKTEIDDKAIQTLYQVFQILEPLIPQKALEEHKNKK